MYIIKPLEKFTAWLGDIKDSNVRIRLARRLDKAAHGLLGDVEPWAYVLCSQR
jgi:putative component of toxin-antitoxin plasmid stabilization module